MSMTDGLTDSSSQNIEAVRQAAAEVWSDNSIMADLCLAQAILESNLTGKPSELARHYNNLFGIKAMGTNGYINMPTHEYQDGKMIEVDQNFAWNDTLEDSIRQYRKVLELPRYQRVLAATTFEQAANEVRQCGYATDPAYSKSLIAIYNEYIEE